MNQILLGASIPFLVAALVYARRRGCVGLPFLTLTPLAMALGALYAKLPDIPRLFGQQELYIRLANDPRTNLFLWHYRIDQVETDSPIYATGMLAMVLLLMFAAWRRLHQLETSPD